MFPIMSTRLDGIICTPEEYSRSLNDSSIHCLTRGQSIGLTLAAESGFVSLVAVLWVFVIIFRNVARHIRHAPPGKYHMVQEPMDIFMLSLFFADLVQALGAVMDVKWVNDGKVEIGNFCTAQGVMQQLGETGVAITTLVIAVYTFIGVWWRKGIRAPLTAKIIIGFVWVFVILAVAIGNITHRNKQELYQSPTPYWCWIGEGYMGFRIWGEYIWLWITLFFSLLAYIPLFFWSRGNITVSEETWWKFSIHRTANVEDPGGRRMTSLTMIAYPLVYSILVLPLSVVRWVGFVQERGGRLSHIASSATLTVVTIYGLSGAMNVVLLFVTRPNSLLFGHTQVYDTDGRAPSPSSSNTSPTPKGSNHMVREGHSDGLQLGRLPSISDAG